MTAGSHSAAPVSLDDAAGALGALERAAREASAGGVPPVERWNPPYCGDLDIRIAADGTWYYLGTPIGRRRLVKLFSSVLRRDEDGRHYLVTPVERIGIAVDDAPFVAVEMAVEGRGRNGRIGLRTHVDDFVVVDADHPLRFETESGTDGLKPYVRIRGRLEALVARSVFYDLVELGEEQEVDGVAMFGVWSEGVFFPMASSETLADAR